MPGAGGREGTPTHIRHLPLGVVVERGCTPTPRQLPVELTAPIFFFFEELRCRGNLSERRVGGGGWGSDERWANGRGDVGAALLREMIARPSAAAQSAQAAKLGMSKPGAEFRAALEEAVLADYCSLVRPAE